MQFPGRVSLPGFGRVVLTSMMSFPPSTPQATQQPSGVKVPNAETQEALRQTYERKGLTESNSLNDLISSSPA